MLSPDILVSVIVPAYLRPELLERAVRSVLDQDLDPARYEVIVVDSSPDDANVRLIESLQPDARCSLRCLTKPPEGPGPSRNLGARESRGRYLAFMDSDCQASRSWLRQGVAAFDDDDGLVQGRTIPEPGAPHSVFNRSLTIESEHFIYHTANIFYRREPFEEAGGFFAEPNPHVLKVIGGEDVDLAWRVKRAGWASRFAQSALVTHVVEVVSVRRWLVDDRMVVLPRVARDFPETRRFFFARYFFDDTQAWLCLALLGLAVLPFSWLGLLSVLPYALKRGGGHTRTLRGPLRLVRVAVYFPRDFATFALLVRGSLLFRTVLL